MPQAYEVLLHLLLVYLAIPPETGHTKSCPEPSICRPQPHVVTIGWLLELSLKKAT